MALTYVLAPMPKWYFADEFGVPLGGGYLATQSSKNPGIQKTVFEDQGGNVAWPYIPIPNQPLRGILLDENGTLGPIYWQVNSNDLTDNYYIAAYDMNGVQQWAIPNFFPPGSGGGTVTTATNIDNFVVNNVFWRNSGQSNITTSTALKLAPGAHAGFANNPANLAGLYTGPDIYFIKNNTNAVDHLSFLPFSFGSSPFAPGDIAPVDYLNYTCTNTPAGETIKCVQFPISKNVQTTANQIASMTIWARCNSGNNNLTLRWFQFFGDSAGATAPFVSNIQTLQLTPGWAQYPVGANIPSVAAKSLGATNFTGNDALFLQILYPLGAQTSIDFTKPCVYFGNAAPTLFYETYDEIDMIINSPRTGYVFPGYDLVAPPGYLMMDDGTIGSAASGATSNGGLGASVQSFPLYVWLYTNVTVPSANAWCAVTGYTGDAVADFVAGRVMNLPRALGRSLAGAGSGSGLTAKVLGQFLGAESSNNVPSHTHIATAAVTGGVAGSTPAHITYGADLNNISQNYNVTVNANAGAAATPTITPSTYLNYFIKL